MINNSYDVEVSVYDTASTDQVTSVRVGAVDLDAVPDVLSATVGALVHALVARQAPAVREAVRVAAQFGDDPSLAAMREKLHPEPAPPEPTPAAAESAEHWRSSAIDRKSLLNQIATAVSDHNGGTWVPEHELPDAVSRIANRPVIADIRPALVHTLTPASDVPPSESELRRYGLDVPPASADPAEFVSAVSFVVGRAVTYYKLATERKALLDRLAGLVGLDGREYAPEDLFRRLDADLGLLRKRAPDMGTT